MYIHFSGGGSFYSMPLYYLLNFISGVVKILKYKNSENVTKSQVRKFKENFDFDKNEENLLKLYKERLPKNVKPMSGIS